jgi:hypothetical protein
LERRLRILFSAAAGILLAAGQAFAQSVGLADILAANANCSSVADARASLEHTLGQASPDTSQLVIVSALRQIAERGDLCTELKEAARNFADQAVDETPEKRAEEAISSASSSIVAATLAEAQRRAENLKFDVAPPPRFMTKERISRP